MANTGKRFVVVKKTLTVDTNIYAALDAVDQPFILPNVAVGIGRPTRLSAIQITDHANQKSALNFHFFAAAVAATVVDNTAFVPTDADLVNFIGFAKVAASDYLSYSTTRAAASVVGAAGNLGILPIVTVGVRDIYCQVVSGGTPTYAAGTDIHLRFVFEQDL